MILYKTLSVGDIMEYSLENKKINLNKANIIGYGKTGNVYKYKNLALKIFPNGNIPYGLMDGETCHDLGNINTNSILLPKNIVYYKKKVFSGYSLKPLNDNKNRNIAKMDKDIFVGNVELLEEDILTLSNKGVLLDGILPENVIFSDRIYLTDPSKYSFVDKRFSSGLYDLNNYQMHLLLTKLVLSSLKKSDITTKDLKRMKAILLSKNDKELSSYFFDNLIGNEKNIYTYVKKMSS